MYLESSKDNSYSTNSIQSGVEESNQSIFAWSSVVCEWLATLEMKKINKHTPTTLTTVPLTTVELTPQLEPGASVVLAHPQHPN